MAGAWGLAGCSCCHLTLCRCHACAPRPLSCHLPLALPQQLAQRVAAATTKPLVVVLVHGGPLDVSELAASPRVGALLTLWYPGQGGSAALGDILAGRLSPSGRCSSDWVAARRPARGERSLCPVWLAAACPPCLHPARPACLPACRPPAGELAPRLVHSAAAHDRRPHARLERLPRCVWGSCGCGLQASCMRR